MCGICGIFGHGAGAEPVDRELLRRMNDSIRHRGPDEDGFHVAGPVGLAMRRLSIIDLSGGRQPIANEAGDVHIVFNGEIYNYRELREELLARGHRFATRSDTEVIVHLYEEYGRDCLGRLDGMFVFAIHDARDDSLFIARDRLGKKPLYYADLGDALLFASELKPLLLHPRFSRELDPEALHHYLSLLMIPEPLSVFKAARKLPAGHSLVCDSGGARLERWWSWLDHLGSRRVPEEEAAAEVRRLLFQAVEKRLVADVPLGAFLSGGLDSSAVVAIMSRLSNRPVKTFSIGFEGGEGFDERPHAAAMASHCGAEHREFVARPDIIESLYETARYADEPFAISSAMPLLAIAKAARQEVAVVLTGDGGDEVFGGYSTYLFERWAQAWRRLPPFVDAVALGAASLLGGRSDTRSGRLRDRLMRFLGTARQDAAGRRLGWANVCAESEKDRLLAPAWRGRGAAFSTSGRLAARLAERADVAALEPAAQANLLDCLIWLPDEMLCKVDRMTMGASIEARCPLLDWKLVEYLAGIDFSAKVPPASPLGGRDPLKRLLRLAVGDLLPPEILNRPKHGFNTPLDVWFRSGARPFLEETLAPERVKKRGVFDSAAVSDLLARHQAGRLNANNRIYALLVFETWVEQYL